MSSLFFIYALLIMESPGVVKAMTSLTIYSISNFCNSQRNAFTYLSDEKFCLKSRTKISPMAIILIPSPVVPEL